jgi:hypothetical protein
MQKTGAGPLDPVWGYAMCNNVTQEIAVGGKVAGILVSRYHAAILGVLMRVANRPTLKLIAATILTIGVTADAGGLCRMVCGRNHLSLGR